MVVLWVVVNGVCVVSDVAVGTLLTTEPIGGVVGVKVPPV